MKIVNTALLLVLWALLFVSTRAEALDKGTGRLVSVTAVDGGCLSGPIGNTNEFWDIEPGFSYRLRIEDVTECATGGTDPTLDVRLNSSIPNHEYTDIVATYVAPGVYEFEYTLPAEAWCTLPVLYCTTPGEWLTTGLFVRRHDGAGNSNGVPYTAHLRASTWSSECTEPVTILGPECGLPIPVEETTWGTIKVMYR